MIPKELFVSAINGLGLSLRSPERTLALFDAYATALAETNKVMNLTAVDDAEGIALRHFADSLAVAAAYPDALKGRLIDVGCGAGFPGLPLKLLADDAGEPGFRLTLLDSTGKRMAFLERVCAELGLQNIEFLTLRAEDAGHSPRFRAKFDCAVSRAVAPMPVLAELCLPLLRVGGMFLPHKSERAAAEADAASGAIRFLGGSRGEDYVYSLPPEHAKSLVLRIAKRAPTPEQYPRAYAKIAAKPLGGKQ